MSRKSVYLVIVQFVTLVGLLISTQRPLPVTSIILLGLGILVGILALLEMRKSKFRIQPEIAREASLIKTGIYRYIRHPMYLAVILVALAAAISPVNWWRTILFFILLDDLLQKIRFEERLLQAQFSDYKFYQKQTKKLIPLVY